MSWTERCYLPPDRETARRLMRVYRRHGAWTWNATHRWPKRETLYGIHPPGSPDPQFPMEGEWVLDVERLCWWPLALGPLRRCLQADAESVVDWAHPRLTEAGIAITDSAARGRYEANYSHLTLALRQVLSGAATVYTHNPWGEYGHAEHIQVHRAVASLQPELGYTLWFSNYVSRKSWPLACNLSTRMSWTERCYLPPDRETARRLMRVYRRHGAWTWNATHRWPKRETLYGIHPPGSPDPQFPMEGEWVLDVERLCWWPLALGPLRRCLQADA